MKPGIAAKAAYGTLVAAGLIVAVGMATNTLPIRAAGALAFVPAEIDAAGEAATLAPRNVKLILRNATRRALVIERVTSTCSCARIQLPKELPIDCPKNSDLECQLTIEPPPSPGTVQVEITALGRTEKGEQLSAKAAVLVRGIQRFSADPPVISLGELAPQSEKKRIDVMLRRHPDAPFGGIKRIDAPREQGVRVYAMQMLKTAQPDEKTGLIPFCKMTLSIDPSKVPRKLSAKVAVELDDGELLQVPVLGWGADSR
jgi:hypothetical protein